MNFPQTLTPFSQSILHPVMTASLRRAATHLDVGISGDPKAALARHGGINALLAEMTVALWGASPPTVAGLLNTDTPTGASPRGGKVSRGMKTGKQLLEAFPQVYGRLKNWSRWVFASEWSQAQLLQVMEEVEPMAGEALTWLHLTAVIAAGSYAHLGDLIAKFEKNPARARGLRLGLTAGLETPDGQLIAMLEGGVTTDKLRENFGHVALSDPYEIASPRIDEMAEAIIGDEAPPEAINWDLSRARGRQKDALEQAHARAGFLGRSGMKQAITLTQTALITHAKARDALAYVLAAARHWAKAAAEEGMDDHRIHTPDEIYMLEIEEIKQMMTGEWHSREHVAPLIAQRQQAYRQAVEPPPAASHPLGVAGGRAQGSLQKPPAPDACRKPAGFIALAQNWDPTWWRVLLMAEGVIATDGDLLSWIASVARMGDLPALVGGAAYADWPEGVTVELAPAQNQVQKND